MKNLKLTPACKLTPANNFKGTFPLKYDVFVNRNEMEKSISDFFENFEKPDGITQNVIGYVLNPDINESDPIGYMLECYVDSGSNDYYYTVLIHIKEY